MALWRVEVAAAWPVLVLGLLYLVAGPVVGVLIGLRKNRPVLGVVLGVLFGVLGWVVIAVVPSKRLTGPVVGWSQAPYGPGDRPQVTSEVQPPFAEPSARPAWPPRIDF